MLTSDELRRTYIDFFVRRGHTEIPGGWLIPTDSSVLFTTAGIQPLVPYFGGAPHPSGRRLVDVQRCLRTVDIDEVGDATHLTAFEMLGNWSLGDYGKRESLAWTLELLVDTLGLDFERLTFTVYPGDDEAFDRWVELGVAPDRISALEDNWWGPPGPHGPCGPDSEVFYDGVEIANNVFITHEQTSGGRSGRSRTPASTSGWGSSASSRSCRVSARSTRRTSSTSRAPRAPNGSWPTTCAAHNG